MQTQHLSTAILKGYGKILPFAFDKGNDYHLEKKEFFSDAPIEKYVSDDTIIIDYCSGMSLLVIYASDSSPVVFYLDRIIQLNPGVPFSIIPADRSCNVNIFLHSPAVLHALGTVQQNFEMYISPILHVKKIYTFFYQESSQDFYFRGESHEPYEMVYVDKGNLHTLVNGQDIILSQNELLIIGHNDWHMQYADETVSFFTLSFEITDDSLSTVINQRLTLSSGTKALFAQMLAERDRKDAYSYDALEALLKLVLIELLREKKHHGNSSVLPSTIHAENDVVNRVLQFISENLYRKLTLSELADVVHVSIPYLYRLFDSHLGMPPGQYVTRMRLEECKALLREGELSMNAIAKIMGFSSAQHFSKQFHRVFGITPTEYARSLR